MLTVSWFASRTVHVGLHMQIYRINVDCAEVKVKLCVSVSVPMVPGALTEFPESLSCFADDAENVDLTSWKNFSQWVQCKYFLDCCKNHNLAAQSQTFVTLAYARQGTDWGFPEMQCTTDDQQRPLHRHLITGDSLPWSSVINFNTYIKYVASSVVRCISGKSQSVPRREYGTYEWIKQHTKRCLLWNRHNAPL